MPIITSIGFRQASILYGPHSVYHLQDELTPLLKIPEKNHLATTGSVGNIQSSIYLFLPLHSASLKLLNIMSQAMAQKVKIHF